MCFPPKFRILLISVIKVWHTITRKVNIDRKGEDEEVEHRGF